MIVTPSNLELLLHCYYSPEPHPRHHAPAILEGADYLLNHGMIVRVEDTVQVQNVPGAPPLYSVTEKGAVYIQHLMKVPFPTPVWGIPS